MATAINAAKMMSFMVVGIGVVAIFGVRGTFGGLLICWKDRELRFRRVDFLYFTVDNSINLLVNHFSSHLDLSYPFRV